MLRISTNIIKHNQRERERQREGEMTVESAFGRNQPEIPGTKKIAVTDRWTLRGKTALVTGGSRGIGYVRSSSHHPGKHRMITVST
jgi:hypothetical protein